MGRDMLPLGGWCCCWRRTGPAQDRGHYDYHVDVRNGLDETVDVSCDGKRPFELRHNEVKSINMHGGTSLHVRCEARDHYGRTFRRAFALDEHDRSADWLIIEGQDDHGHEDRR